MANRHFAKLADVWKHLPLVEILSIERPRNYWESHAGNAVYPMVDDPEREYGAQRFVEIASQFGALSRSRYVGQLTAMNPSPGRLTSYPGSPLLAMRELGAEASYLFCDLAGESVTDLDAAAARLELRSRVQVVGSDGMTALHEALDATVGDGTILAHIDPYDPRAIGPCGLSAVDLACELIEREVGLVYWYGYDRPDQRTWAFDELRQRSGTRTAWCGDVMVASDGVGRTDGDLGVATTPGTGFGVVCDNVCDDAIAACRQLGQELARAYEGAALPDGSPGRLDFISRSAVRAD